jgi:hypothetical protein
MAMKLDRVVPFGRTLAEYQLMFNLTDKDYEQKPDFSREVGFLVITPFTLIVRCKTPRWRLKPRLYKQNPPARVR